MIDSEFFEFYKSNIEDINHVERFEELLINKFKTKYAVACSSGTAAIHCALLAVGVKEGDEVIVPNLTVMMTIMPILYIGAIPIFVDCQKDCIDFDYNDLKNKISKKTKAIIPVYMWGMSYNLDELQKFAKKYSLKIIEDACQAQGSKYKGKLLGTFGDIGCFSLKDGKIISSGEGGYILTDNKILAERVKNYRNHQINQNPELSFTDLGFNYRMTNIQAYLAIKSLKDFENNLSKRKNFCDKFYSLDMSDDNLLKLQKDTNYFSPLIKLKNKTIEYFTGSGIVNSVGTFGLKAASKRKVVIDYLTNKKIDHKIKTENCDNFLSNLLAISLSNDNLKNEELLCKFKEKILSE